MRMFLTDRTSIPGLRAGAETPGGEPARGQGPRQPGGRLGDILLGVGRDFGPREISLAGDAVYVANQGASTLSVIDQRTLKPTATIATGNSPYGIAVVQPQTTNR